MNRPKKTFSAWQFSKRWVIYLCNSLIKFLKNSDASQTTSVAPWQLSFPPRPEEQLKANASRIRWGACSTSPHASNSLGLGVSCLDREVCSRELTINSLMTKYHFKTRTTHWSLGLSYVPINCIAGFHLSAFPSEEWNNSKSLWTTIAKLHVPLEWRDQGHFPVTSGTDGHILECWIGFKHYRTYLWKSHTTIQRV